LSKKKLLQPISCIFLILKNSEYEVIVVNYDTDNKSLLELNKVTSSCRAVDKVLNIEKMTDLTQIYFDTCYRNAKCVNQPSNKFYELYNKMNVFETILKL
jgi:hypothetical protein